MNDAECVRTAISNGNWELVELILSIPLTPTIASAVLASLPTSTPHSVRFRIIRSLVQFGASGLPLSGWLLKAVEESDFQLMDFLLQAGAPLEAGDNRALHSAVVKKDLRSLQTLLKARPSPQVLCELFPLLRQGYLPGERLDVARMLLEYGARGVQVDQALVDAVADTSDSRDLALITELLRYGANVNYNEGKVVSLAATQADIAVLRLAYGSKPSSRTTSAALPLAFDAHGERHSLTLEIIELLLNFGMEEAPAQRALELAVHGSLDNTDIINRLISYNKKLVGPAFKFAVALKSTRRKTPFLKSLLPMGVPQNAIDEALVAETRHVLESNDTTILKLLLDNGASINHNTGEALSIGISSGNRILATLLLGGKENPSSTIITKAFHALFHNLQSKIEVTGQNDLVKIAEDLLSRGVEQSAIDSTLRSVLNVATQSRNIGALVDLLLQYHANINTADGTCLVSN